MRGRRGRGPAKGHPGKERASGAGGPGLPPPQPGAPPAGPSPASLTPAPSVRAPPALSVRVSVPGPSCCPLPSRVLSLPRSRPRPSALPARSRLPASAWAPPPPVGAALPPPATRSSPALSAALGSRSGAGPGASVSGSGRVRACGSEDGVRAGRRCGAGVGRCLWGVPVAHTPGCPARLSGETLGELGVCWGRRGPCSRRRRGRRSCAGLM